MLTPSDLTELRRLQEKATPTPWSKKHYPEKDGLRDWNEVSWNNRKEEDADLILALVNAAPDLLRLAEAGLALREAVYAYTETLSDDVDLHRALAVYDETVNNKSL